MNYYIKIPKLKLKTPNSRGTYVGNQKVAWGIASQEKKELKDLLSLYLLESGVKPIGNEIVEIRLVRIAPRPLAFDGHVASCKHVRDYVADWLIPGLPIGRADDDPRLKFEYLQEKGKPKEYALRIEIIIEKDQSVCF